MRIFVLDRGSEVLPVRLDQLRNRDWLAEHTLVGDHGGVCTQNRQPLRPNGIVKDATRLFAGQSQHVVHRRFVVARRLVVTDMRDIAVRLGVEATFSEDREEMQWVRHIYDETRAAMAARGVLRGGTDPRPGGLALGI